MGKKNQNHTLHRDIRKLLKEDLKDDSTQKILEIIDSLKKEFFISENKDSLLCAAVKKGNIDVVKKLIEKGALVSEVDRKGQSPLHIAAKNGNVEIMLFLLQNGTDVQDRTQGGDSALFVAINNEQAAAVDCLLEHGADPSLPSSFLYNKDLPLHRAAVLPDNKILNRILESSADINALNADSQTALHLAAKKGCHKNVERLLKCGAQPDMVDSTGHTAILYAAASAHVECVRLLCIHGASVNVENSESENALKTAVSKRHINVVRTLLHFGANVNKEFSDGKSCLMATIGNCCHKMVTEWGGKNWKKREDNCNINEEIEMLDILVAAGADLSATHDGDSCLHVCVREGCAHVLQYLLASGADCQQLNRRGETALSLACRHNTTPAIEILIKHCPALINHSSVTDQPPDPTRVCEMIYLGQGNFSPMVQLYMKANLSCMKLLCEAGYRFSPQERTFFEMVFDEPQQNRKRKRNKDRALRTHLRSEFSHPWTLSRIARTTIRDTLATHLPEKSARLGIPQILQAGLCLSV